MVRTSNNTPPPTRSGAFQRLPCEIQLQILEKLSLDDLANITITSKDLREVVYQHFFKNKSGFNKLLPKEFCSYGNTEDEVKIKIKRFEKLGKLLKKMTCINPTTDRMTLLIEVINKFDGFPVFEASRNRLESVTFTFKCVGKLLHKFIAGWDNSECVHVYDHMAGQTHIEQYVQRILRTSVGAMQSLEYFVRMYFRLVFVDPCTNVQDRFFWLTQILQLYNDKTRVKLLMLLFGPLVHNTHQMLPYVGWWDVTDSFFIEDGLSELGMCFQVLFFKLAVDKPEAVDSSQLVDSMIGWDVPMLIKLIEGITSTPEQWLPENTANLLFFCGEKIITRVLKAKILSKRCADVALNIVYLTLVFHKRTHSVRFIHSLVNELQKVIRDSKLEMNLNSEISLAFGDVITDLDNLLEMEDERDVTELNDLIRAQCSYMQLLMNKMYRAVDDESASEPSSSQRLMISEE